MTNQKLSLQKIISSITLLATLLFTLPAFSQGEKTAPAIPEPAAEKLASSFVDAVNTGDRSLLRAFLSENVDPNVLRRFPLDTVVGMNMSFFYESAGKGMKYNGIISSDAKGIQAAVTNSHTGAKLTLTIPLSGTDDPKIAGRCEMKLSQDENTPSNVMSNETIAAKLENCVELLLADDEFSGTIIVAKDGKPFYSKSCGMASKAYSIENNLDTQFNVASLGKMFTGVAITQLAERGKLSFDDPIAKHLPEGWVSPEIAEKTTIRHLLTHTSGYGTYFRALYTQIKQPFFRGLNDYKGIISEEKPSFEPGERWSYSNSGMHLLGVIIENVTGGSYYDYMRDNVFEPAGMTRTDFRDKDIPLSNRATPYVKEAGEWRTSLFARVLKGGPSGGGYSTVPDLLKFRNALLNNQLLSAEYTDLALSVKPEVNSTFYGYGFFLSSGKAGRVAEHGGDGTGISTQFKMYLDSGYTVTVLSNFSRPAAQIIANVAGQMIER